MKSIVYDANFLDVQRLLGKRPGGYTLDPYYLRKGHGGKPWFWDDENRKWILVHVGDKFFIDDDGTVTLNA
jgi:hypothetical protein